MHPNPIFRKTTTPDALAFARRRGFGVLTLNGAEGPIAAHLPFVISPDGREIDMHVLRSNPVNAALDTPQKALLAVSGPDGYISPDWYGVEDQVPTWNYIAVHLRGELERRPQKEILNSLTKLSDNFEQRLAPKPVWKLDKVDAEKLAKMARMIVPVRLRIDSVDSTWKLGQNKPEAAITGAANGLATSDSGHEITALADWMRSLND